MDICSKCGVLVGFFETFTYKQYEYLCKRCYVDIKTKEADQMKVNVEEIQVGDLVEMTYTAEHKYREKVLGVATQIQSNGVRAHWSDSNAIEFTMANSITGHWKVINFEEEANKMKVLTGKEAIEALLEGKTLQTKTGSLYKLIENELYSENVEFGGTNYKSLTELLNMSFTEYTPKPKVGDWARATIGYDGYSKEYISKVTQINSEGIWGEWNQPTSDIISPIELDDNVTWEILTPEQVAEYTREQAFKRAGRKLNEFKRDDIVLLENGIVGVVTTSVNTVEVGTKEINRGHKWKSTPERITPVYFSENQVNLNL